MSKKDDFGTIIFESNLDKDLETIYQLYSNRWDIEIIFKFYKNILEFNDVRVQQNTRLWGMEFINFISTIIVSKVKHYFDKIGLFKDYSYNQIMTSLSKLQKIKDYSSKIDDNKTRWVNTVHIGQVDKIIKRIGEDKFEYSGSIGIGL